MGEDEVDVSYDVKSLFTSIPLAETIEYILDQIYVHQAIEPFCHKRLIFKNFLIWLTKDCLFSANNKLFKQVEGCPMGGPISVAIANIFMAKLEKDVIKPPYPIFYKRYVDDTYVRRKKGIRDVLFEDLNSYHENIHFTIEKNPKKFLDTKITFEGDTMITEVVSNDSKLPTHWSSKIPKRYKRNNINGELHRAKMISSNFEKEVQRIRLKFKNAGYPLRFINSVILPFENGESRQKQQQEEKPKVTIDLAYCPENEDFSKIFIQRLNNFTENKFSFVILWKTRKIRSLFYLKDKITNIHKSDIIYEGICSCNETYIGESDRNVCIRWSEHDNIKKTSEPSKHLKVFKDHKFSWKILSNAPRGYHKRKILETFFIKIKRPSLNNQIENYQLKLFHNGVT